ncbi:hypothetical protein L6164_015474 [Bauhinia variegata]|uniref:Uncharacterized protein n=1 Tax=Bauhinia variegata TaxID=167791 RepID=A0ACB9NLA3_BAUVA|nr:hypothetical protein L6164_015474 [Bauhinia variegata]
MLTKEILHSLRLILTLNITQGAFLLSEVLPLTWNSHSFKTDTNGITIPRTKGYMLGGWFHHPELRCIPKHQRMLKGPVCE